MIVEYFVGKGLSVLSDYMASGKALPNELWMLQRFLINFDIKLQARLDYQHTHWLHCSRSFLFGQFSKRTDEVSGIWRLDALQKRCNIHFLSRGTLHKETTRLLLSVIGNSVKARHYLSISDFIELCRVFQDIWSTIDSYNVVP